MFALLATHFDGVSRDGFDTDLSAKNWVVLIEDDRGTLVGFSTILAYEANVAGETLSVVYSGDTIVAPARGVLRRCPKAWIGAVYELRQLHANGRLIWLLLTGGFRAYRFLPDLLARVLPAARRCHASPWQTMLDELASRLFGDRFDRAAGVGAVCQPTATSRR